jgi:murein DD-endopeptidase MepM/ murein hydrolase activator NlpD
LGQAVGLSGAKNKSEFTTAIMRRKHYTFFIASNESGKLRRLRIPGYLLHVLGVLALVGGATVLVAIGSYSRMLWKVTNYDSMRRDQETLKQQYSKLQTQVKDANERLNSLQSLANQVAVAYGLIRVPEIPFSQSDNSVEAKSAYQETRYQFDYLQQNASAVFMLASGAPLLPGAKLPNASFIPSLWPVMGRITSPFGERLDPFGGEGEFHTGIDIASHYGDPVRAAADGVVIWVGDDDGYGRMVMIDHGFGITSLYAHLAGYATQVGTRVRRGDVIGYEGDSGRATGPHVHFEVRIHGTPVNPWPYLKQVDSGGEMANGG